MSSSESSSSSDEDYIPVPENLIAIPMDDNLKSKLMRDLSAICEVTEEAARQMLIGHDWDIQAAIDSYLEHNAENENGGADVHEVEVIEDDNKVVEPDSTGIEMEHSEPKSQEPVAVAGSSRAVTTQASGSESKLKARLDMGSRPSENSFATTTSNMAPETLSVLSWNLDGLDEKNLTLRTEAVIKLIEEENHAIVFLQELLPYTFQLIAEKLASKYFAVVGTESPESQYFVATFLRLNHVFYEDHHIVPYANTTMDRKLLVTKAFSGGAKLYLLNTHLESTRDFAKQRHDQLQLCFQHCSRIPLNYNVIFGGDLNLRDSEVGQMPDNVYDLWSLLGSRETCRYTWDLTRNTNKQMPSRSQPRCRFDRLYFRGSIPKTLTPEFFGITGIEKVPRTQSFPSDHWAIIAFFRLTDDARKPQVGLKRKANENDDDEPVPIDLD